ncbi:hypothetical protein ACTJ2N_000642 [Vibrio fluvialis]
MAQIGLLIVTASILLFPAKEGHKLAGDFAEYKAKQESITSQVDALIQSKLYDYIEGNDTCNFKVKISKDGLIKIIEIKGSTRRNSCMRAFESLQNNRLNRPTGEVYQGLISITEEKPH